MAIKKPELDLKIIERNVATPKIRLSASKLKMIKECFGKYFYKYIAEVKVPEKTWPATIYGLVCHGVLEESLLARQDGQSEKEIFLQHTQPGNFKALFYKTIEAEKEKNRKMGHPRFYDEEEFIAQAEDGLKTFLKFVLGYFKNFHKLLPEEELEADWEWDKEITLGGVADLPMFLEKLIYRIIDFKTTQHSENFYFVNWFEDIQSLMYIYMCWKKFGIFPQGFDYLVFNWKENNIFLNSITHATPPADDKMKDFFKGLHQILLEAKIMHRAPKKSYYFPTVEKCRFCDYKSICDKAIKT